MKTLSVTQYAKQQNVTRSAILKRIKLKKMKKNTTVKRVGSTYIINVDENNNYKSTIVQ